MTAKLPGDVLSDPRTWENLLRRIAERASAQILSELSIRVGTQLKSDLESAAARMSEILSQELRPVEKEIARAHAALDALARQQERMEEVLGRVAPAVDAAIGAALGQMDREIEARIVTLDAQGARLEAGAAEAQANLSQAIDQRIAALNTQQAKMEAILLQLSPTMEEAAAGAIARMDLEMEARKEMIAAIAAGEGVALANALSAFQLRQATTKALTLYWELDSDGKRLDETQRKLQTLLSHRTIRQMLWFGEMPPELREVMRAYNETLTSLMQNALPRAGQIWRELQTLSENVEPLAARQEVAEMQGEAE